MHSLRQRLIVSVACVVFASCGSSSTEDGDTGGLSKPGADGGIDAGGDGGVDVGGDGGVDVGVDVGGDGGSDGQEGSEVGADGGDSGEAGPVEEPIPPDAIHLNPATGDVSNPGTEAAPWPGLEDSIAAGLLAKMPDGKTLVLHEGNHGKAVWEGEHATAVILRAAPGQRPRLGRLEIKKGRGWHLGGLTISPAFAASPYEGNIVMLGESGASSDIVLKNSVVYTVDDAQAWTPDDWIKANSGVLLGRHGTNLSVRGTHVYNVRFGVTIASFDSSVEGNLIEDFSADGIRVTRDGGVVNDNVIKNVRVSDADGDSNHDDAIQCFLFNKGTGTVRNVTLRGNLILNYEGSPAFPNQMQGIGFFDGPLVDFVIEDNVVFVDHYHGVSLYDAQGARIVNNVAYTRWGDGKVKPWVMLGEKQGLASGNYVHGNRAHSFQFKADPLVDAADNEIIDPAVAEQRFSQRLSEIEAKWGALVDGAPRIHP